MLRRMIGWTITTAVIWIEKPLSIWAEWRFWIASHRREKQDELRALRKRYSELRTEAWSKRYP